MAKATKENCGQCNGSRKKKYPGKKYEESCTYCGGSGKVMVWK